MLYGNNFGETPRHTENKGIARAAERGASRLKAIIYIAILGVLIFAGIKVIPILLNGYEFEDSMKTTARFASVNRQTPDDIRKALMQEAAKDDVPIKADDLHITSEAGNIRIEGSYTVTVDLSFYQLTLNFHPSAINNAL